MKPIAVAAIAAGMLFAARAEEPAVSPACAMLTAEETAAIFGHPAMISDGGPGTMGISACAWVDEETFNAIGLNLMEGEAIGAADPAAVYESTKDTMKSQGVFEDVADVGEKAALLTSTDTTADTRVLILLKNAKIVTINGTGIPNEGMVAFGKAVAGRM